MKTLGIGLLVLCLCPAAAQQTESVPLYRVTVVGRTAKAINYRHRSGPTKIDFRGTVLLPDARGEAKVESKQGAMQIETRFKGLEPPTRFGREYLTYVLWAITPEGRATNLGQILADDDNEAKLVTSSELQAFGLIVTAEPYYAVTQPSDVVVMENVVRPDTKGKIEEIDAKLELLPRGHYTFHAAPAGERPAETNVKKVSLDKYEELVELYQARNAVQIAGAAGADQYAAETFRKAKQLLEQAEDQHANKAGTKTVIMTARQAAQTAEDARMITVKRIEEEQKARQQATATASPTQ